VAAGTTTQPLSERDGLLMALQPTSSPNSVEASAPAPRPPITDPGPEAIEQAQCKMKSLLISSMYFPPQVGGIANVMAAVTAGLGRDRVSCLTAVPSNQPAASSSFMPKVYRRPRAFGSVKYLHAISWGATIAEIMIRERPRIVQLATVYEGYLGLWLRRWLRLPFVIYAHGNEILAAMQESGYIKPLVALQNADRVLANSHFTASLVQKAGVDPRRIDVIYLGCDPNTFRPVPARVEMRQKLLGDGYKNRVIVTVGNLVSRKGHDMVIRALPRLAQTIPDITYLVVGNGPHRQQLEELACSIGVRDHVVFAGVVPDRDLPDVYALSDVFAMPSRAHLDTCDVEGFGLVFLEANACGKPVVAGRSGGIPEAVEDGVTGLLVNPTDAEDIARAIGKLLTDTDLARRMGHQGRVRVVTRFTWEAIIKRVEKSLEAVLREKITRGGHLDEP